MGIITQMLGIPEDASEAKITIKALKKENKRLVDLVEDLKEQNYLEQHKQDRYDRELIRNAEEAAEDAERLAARQVDLLTQQAQDSEQDAQRKLKRAHAEQLENKDEQIAKLSSKIRTLELEAKERQESNDLAIQEGIFVYRESHAKDVKDFEAKVAALKGELLASQAETKARDRVISNLEKILGERSLEVTQALGLVEKVVPNVDLSSLSFNVTAQAPKQDNQKKN